MRTGLQAALLLMMLVLAPARYACSDEPAESPLAPVDTSSPQATLHSFRANVERAYQGWRLHEGREHIENFAERVLRTLDLAHVGAALRTEIGIDDALYLYETMDRLGFPQPDSVPDAAEVAAKGITRWTLPQTEITIEKAPDGPRAGEFLFSSDTVQRAPHFYSLVQGMPLPSGSPDILAQWRAAPGFLMPNVLAATVWRLPPAAFVTFLNQAAWKWVATLVSILIAGIAVWLLWRVGLKWDRKRRRREQGWLVGQPLALLGTTVAVVTLENWIDDAILLRDQLSVLLSAVLTVLVYVLAAWLVAEVIAKLGNLVVHWFVATARSLDAALIRLCFRIMSIVGALGVVLYAASQLGLSITPILAGLGVGGLAVALAIRPTLENLVGGFVLFADKPVRVGEFCAFGDKMGTVEEIGLRSTQLRGVDRTVITVPNADFAQMQIVNFTRRDMNLFQAKIGVRYETTPDQLRFVSAKIRKLLIQHEKVSPDPARVRFTEFADSSLVLEIFALVRAADWNEFMAVKEDLNLRIAEIVHESGTGFAFPSQTLYLARDGGLDAERSREAEREVAQWREEKRLPFPEFDYAERAEMADTLPFPPPESPDYRPTAPSAGTPAGKRTGAKSSSLWQRLRQRNETA
ncbi:MAG: mechanosensitive ion channel [Geminicoccaceae bacterium]